MNTRETHLLLVQASAIDSRRVTELMITAWQQILANVPFEDGVNALIEHRRTAPGVYLEPGHIVQQARIARARHREIHGIHPSPPAGKRWAVEVIERDMFDAADRELNQ